MVKLYIRRVNDLESKLDRYVSLYLIFFEKVGKKLICEGDGKEIEVLILRENIDSLNSGDIIKVLGIPFKKGDKLIIRAYVVKKISKDEINPRTLKDFLEVISKIQEV